MRFLGIDPGEKRIGLAVGDELGFASPLPALFTAATEQAYCVLFVRPDTTIGDTVPDPVMAPGLQVTV